MSSETPYLTLQAILDEQTDKARAYHSTTIKLYIYGQVLFPIYYIVLVFLKIPGMIADTSPAGSSYSIATIGYTLGILVLMHFVLNLPGAWYKERVEKQYEFSTKSWGKWFVDMIKILVISLILALIFFEGIYFGIDQFKDRWWIVATIVSIIFMAGVLFISPFVISLFTKLESFPAGKTREKVEKLATEMGVKYKDIYLWKMSEQTTKGNAAVLGFGNSIRIVLGDNLVEEFRDDEIEVVMTHEIGHYIHRDVYRYLVYYSILFIMIYFVIEQIFQSAIDRFDYTSRADPASLAFMMVSLILLFMVFDLLSNWYSRKREKAADMLAITKFKNLQIYESAFSRLAKMNLSYPDPSKLEIMFRYTHPPIKDRVRYAKEYISSIS